MPTAGLSPADGDDDGRGASSLAAMLGTGGPGVKEPPGLRPEPEGCRGGRSVAFASVGRLE